MSKRKIVLTVLCSTVIVALIVLAVLVYVPQTRELRYEMNGFIISPKGQILEEFTMTAAGESKEYILDQFARKNKQIEDGILVERDSIFLDLHWDSTAIPESYMDGTFEEHIRLANTPYILGAMYFFDSVSVDIDRFNGMFNQESGALCLYADNLNAFIVGISNPDTTPLAVLESYLKIVKNPAEPSPTENNGTAISWDMNGTFVLSDSTAEPVSFSIDGYINDTQDDLDELYITIEFPDNFRYLDTPPDPCYVSMNQKANDLPHLMICPTYIYDKQTNSAVWSYYAFDLENEYIVLMIENAPNCYLVASTDPSVAHTELLKHFADFRESYGFDQ